MVQIRRLKNIKDKLGTPAANVNTLSPKDPFDPVEKNPFEAAQTDFQDESFLETLNSFNNEAALNSEIKFNDLAATPFSKFDLPFDNIQIDNWMDKYTFSNFVNQDDKISNITVPKIAFDEPVVEEIQEEVVNVANEPATEKSAVKMDDVAGITPSKGVSV